MSKTRKAWRGRHVLDKSGPTVVVYASNRRDARLEAAERLEIAYIDTTISRAEGLDLPGRREDNS